MKNLNDFYSSTYIIMLIKLRRLRRALYVARMGYKVQDYNILLGKPCLNWSKIKLQGIEYRGCILDASSSEVRKGLVVGPFKHGNESLA
jgi:hypothetical protein